MAWVEVGNSRGRCCKGVAEEAQHGKCQSWEQTQAQCLSSINQLAFYIGEFLSERNGFGFKASLQRNVSYIQVLFSFLSFFFPVGSPGNKMEITENSPCVIPGFISACIPSSVVANDASSSSLRGWGLTRGSHTGTKLKALSPGSLVSSGKCWDHPRISTLIWLKSINIKASNTLLIYADEN